MRTLLLLASASLALSACGDKKGETATASETTSTDATGAAERGTTQVGQNAAVNEVQDVVGAVEGQASGAVVNNADGFIRNAALSDMYEIESSKVALDKSQSKPIKDFANMMIKQHTAMSAELKKIATAPPPTTLDARRQGFIDNLRSADGGNFDRVFANQQTAAHSETQTMMQSYIDDGDNAQLKAFAQRTLPKVETHLRMIKQIDGARSGG